MSKPVINLHPINRKIRAQQVRLIFEDVNQIMTIQQALDFASNQDLDLVQFSSGSTPTCRVLDYSKYRYNEEKKRKIEAGNRNTLKEVQIRPSISSNDLQVKSRHVIEFLSKGSPVRLRIKLRGREKASSDQHGLFLSQFASTFSEYSRIEGKFTNDGVPIGGVLTLKPNANKSTPEGTK